MTASMRKNSASDNPKPKALSAKEFRAGVELLGINAPQFAEVFGLGYSTVARYASEGVPARSSARIRLLLNDVERAKHVVPAMTAKEFRAAFEASGMTVRGLGTVLGVGAKSVARWKHRGVKRQSAARVREVLSRPKDFPEGYRRKREHLIPAEEFRSMCAGMTVKETAALLGEDVSTGMVQGWRTNGVKHKEVARVRAVLCSRGGDPETGQ